MRVVIADDSVLLREGLSRLLGEAGIDTCAMVGDAETLIEAVELHQPELAIVDIRMPPTFTHEGAAAAIRLRKQWASLGILLLSQSLETRYATALVKAHPQRFGYLLKDHILEVATLIDAVQRIAGGGTVLDPDVIRHRHRRAESNPDLLQRHADEDHVEQLPEVPSLDLASREEPVPGRLHRVQRDQGGVERGKRASAEWRGHLPVVGALAAVCDG